jgi:hypothetical protein
MNGFNVPEVPDVPEVPEASTSVRADILAREYSH